MVRKFSMMENYNKVHCDFQGPGSSNSAFPFHMRYTIPKVFCSLSLKGDKQTCQIEHRDQDTDQLCCFRWLSFPKQVSFAHINWVCVLFTWAYILFIRFFLQDPVSLLISTFHRMGIESTAIYTARKKDLLNSEKKKTFFFPFQYVLQFSL